MFTKLLILTTALAVIAVPVLGDEVAERSDRELKRDLDRIEDEIRDLEKYARKLRAAGRSSNNADRGSAVAKILDHMTNVLHDRENAVGQEHTIIRHGSTVQSGLTDAARVGTPIGRKETRRRLKRGTEEHLASEVVQLARLRAIVVSAGLLERPAIERQPDAFERFTKLTDDFGAALEGEANAIRVEQAKRDGTYQAPDSLTVAPETP